MDIRLPPHLAERTRWHVHPSAVAHVPGEFVLYWLHNAIRGHDNPALDVAICLARQNGLPLLVYQGLCETYPYASDRHHAFILQGARDVQREMEGRGVVYHFHLQRDQKRGAFLKDLVRRAGFLVTEEMPVPPLTGWLERLATVTQTPIACVDSTCIVTPSLVSKTFAKAYQFRAETKSLYVQRVERPYPEQLVDCEMFDGPMPFDPVDLQRESLADLIGLCRIDHSIAPVAETPGGTRAGYARWEKYRRDDLASFSKRRNDPIDRTGVSRMSPYLHYGMVSPFRIAREAHQGDADKFLNEFLVRRDLAFHFCYRHFDELETFDALPAWSARSLSDHAEDPRSHDLSWESLSRAKTGQPLWDACQRSLLRHGELHKNVRMSWGKSFIPFVDSPQKALQLCIDLNHRYALDGRDPNSYGGILWCFGLFDRPFVPPSPRFGSVRPRPIQAHQQRLDLDGFCRLVDRPIAGNVPRVA